MKSKSKVPFKSKKNYNLNGVDVNLLLKNPSYIRKIVKGNHKEESYHDRDELEEEEVEDAGDDKLERHMKKYINEYIAKKHLKEAEQRGRVQKRLDILKKFVAPELPDMDKRLKNPEKGIIERKLK
ncbi:MAG: hypothetical protein EBY20_01270 [Alphaproteobacteria bacterium]|nr:hypothetical protein [Alphaproteobacteria bacterium]